MTLLSLSSPSTEDHSAWWAHPLWEAPPLPRFCRVAFVALDHIQVQPPGSREGACVADLLAADRAVLVAYRGSHLHHPGSGQLGLKLDVAADEVVGCNWSAAGYPVSVIRLRRASGAGPR